MAVVFLPSAMLRKMAPKKAIEKLVTGSLSLNRAALQSLARAGIPKGKLERLALKVLAAYRAAFGENRDAGLGVTEAREDATNDNRLMIHRVQNLVVQEAARDLRDEYHGEFFEWLPSDAEEPDPLHQLKYGKTFMIGRDEMPGERIGCRCGMRILVDAEQ